MHFRWSLQLHCQVKAFFDKTGKPIEAVVLGDLARVGVVKGLAPEVGMVKVALGLVALGGGTW